MQYTQFDLDTIKSFKIRYKADSRQGYQDISGDIEFQFPPKIPSDSKRGNWKDALTQYDEPGSLYESVGPREITMTFTYIVTTASNSTDNNYRNYGLSNGGDPNFRSNTQDWTAERIQHQLRKLRGYFNVSRSGAAAFAAQQILGDSLVLEIKLAGIGGTSDMTGRMINADIKHSDTLVSYYEVGNEPGDPTKLNTFPLRTDVTIGLRLWHTNSDAGDDAKIQNVPGLVNKLTVDWY